MKSLCVACLLVLTVGASAQNRFVYVNNQNSPNTITAFQINSNGSLTQLAASPFLIGGSGYSQPNSSGPFESEAVVETRNATYLYAANGADGTVSAFTIDPATGNLQPIAGSPFSMGDSQGTYDLTASPDQRFLFVANQASTVIHVLAISPETGSLSNVAGSPFEASANISGLKVTANDRYLIAAGNSIDAVEVFSIAGSGALTEVPGSPFPASGSVVSVESNCASNRVFGVSNSTNVIDAYSMAPNGRLTPVPGSPFPNGATGSGTNSFDLVLSPDNRFLFTTDSFSADLSSLAVTRNGALVQVPGSPFATGNWEGGTAVTKAGDFLYSVQFASGKVDGRSISPNGTLADVPGTPFGPGNQNSLNGIVDSVITYPAPECGNTR